MLAFLNAIQPMHVLLILVVALLLFGNRLPDVARSIGRAFNEFKRGLREVNDDLGKEDAPSADKPKLAPPQERRDAPPQSASRTAEPVEPAKRDDSAP